MKKGLSTVINAVLLIFLVVVLIGALALYIFPLVKTSIVFSGISTNIVITNAVYDSEEGAVYISIDRKADNANVTGIKFVLSIEGNSEVYDIRSNLPGPNEERSFKLNGVSKKPSYVEVYAYAKKGNSEKLLELSDKKDVKEGKWLEGSNPVDGFLPPEPIIDANY